MSAVATVKKVLAEKDFIGEILRREEKQGCIFNEDAEYRIEAAIIAAVEAAVYCKREW